jgi:hypothetical protein
MKTMRSPVPAARPNPRTRAFALPLVVLLALVAALATAVVLERQGGGYAAVARQVESYKRHHRHLGMEEMVDRWLATTRGAVRERLAADGWAFELELPGNEKVVVRLTDGQGAALRNTDQLSGAERRFALAILSALDDAPDQDLDHPIFRDAGPARISVNSAPLIVLDAVAQAVIGEHGQEARRFVRELDKRRSDGLLVQGDIRGIGQQLELSQEALAGLDLMLTADPSVWRVVADDTGTGFASRVGGLVQISQEPAGLGLSNRFLTWEGLPPP